MLRLHFAGPEPHTIPGSLVLAGSTTTVGATIDVLRSTDLDALLFSPAWALPMKSIRHSMPVDSIPTFIVVRNNSSRASIIHSFACGFDGVVNAHGDTRSLLRKIEQVIEGSWTFESEPWLRELGLTRGLLARDLVYSDEYDDELLDLVSIGLPDEKIAVLMEWNVQRVRNRIERLLSDNELTYRTQLAVVRVASLKVPDFS